MSAKGVGKLNYWGGVSCLVFCIYAHLVAQNTKHETRNEDFFSPSGYWSNGLRARLEEIHLKALRRCKPPDLLQAPGQHRRYFAPTPKREAR